MLAVKRETPEHSTAGPETKTEKNQPVTSLTRLGLRRLVNYPVFISEAGFLYGT
jgi:hypothetical protein